MARKKRKCGIKGCSTKIAATHYFCTPCLNRVPQWMKNDFFAAYKARNGMELIAITKRIRDFIANLQEKKPRDYYTD